MGPTLFQIGPLTVSVTPFNFHEWDQGTGADFAAKDVVGAPKPREFTGEADTSLKFRGKLYPHRFGGMTELEIAEQLSKAGEPQMVVRGDGVVMGWYFVEKLEARHGTLTAAGVGREIEVDVELMKSPNAASAEGMLAFLLGLF